MKHHQSIVGIIMHLVQCSRPDVAYAACVLAQKAKKTYKI